MKVKLEILTPVHISSGAELSPSEYYIDRKTNEFKVVNLNSLFTDPDFKKYQEDFIEKASYSRYLGDIINDYNLLSRHILYSLPTTLEFRSANKINVKAFIKSAGKVYVPGSSLKGAMVSALLYRALLDLSKAKGKEKITSLFTSRDSRAYDDILNICYKYLTNIPDPDNNRQHSEMKFLRLFSVSDTNLLQPNKCLRADICHVVGARSSRSIPIMYETLRAGTVFEFELKNTGCRFSEKEILAICDDFYRKVASEENLKHLDNQNRYLIRLGQGSSRIALSFYLAARALQIQEYLRRYGLPRTRKRIKDGTDIEMGFARMEFSS
ncbi:MAG: type III-A CRISPR-associated RAMP protein Csm5 [Candidatus Saccharicenans sp.]